MMQGMKEKEGEESLSELLRMSLKAMIVDTLEQEVKEFIKVD